MLLTATATAISPGLTSSFLASGGTAPYTYSIKTSGAGGSINSSTGIYTAPDTMSNLPDVIEAQDSLGSTAELSIMVGNHLLLFCDIIKEGMDLDSSQVYVYNQKINIPTDSKMYVAVGVQSCKPYSNSLSYDASGYAIQSTNFQSTVSIDIMSRGTDARDRKEEIIMALNSHYSIQQQERNSFSIGRIPTSFTNLSEVEGSAIPYRFNISVNLQYFVKKTSETAYYDNGFDHEETVD